MLLFSTVFYQDLIFSLYILAVSHSHQNKTSHSHQSSTPNKPNEDNWSTSEASPVLFPEIHFSSAKREYEMNSTAINDSTPSYQSSEANKYPTEADEDDEDDSNSGVNVSQSKSNTNNTEGKQKIHCFDFICSPIGLN